MRPTRTNVMGNRVERTGQGDSDERAESCRRELTVGRVLFGAGFPEGYPSEQGPWREAGLSFTNNRGNRWCSRFDYGFISSYGWPSQIKINPGADKTFALLAITVCHLNAVVREQFMVLDGVQCGGTHVTITRRTRARVATPQSFLTPGLDNLYSLTISLGWLSLGELVVAS